MKHRRVLVEITEQFSGEDDNKPRNAIIELVKYLVERGYQSLEQEFAGILADFLGYSVDQSMIDQPPDEDMLRATSGKPRPTFYTTCLKNNQTYFFVDVETLWGVLADFSQIKKEKDLDRLFLEIDIFSLNDDLHSAEESIIDNSMKCFGLTKSKQELVMTPASDAHIFDDLRERLVPKQPLNETLFQRLRENADRDILRELKRRVSVLESDLHELPLPGVKPERVKSTLDYFSGEEFRLVDRKSAIVCNKSKEIVFLFRDKHDLDSAKQLQCPKCSSKLGDEKVLAYYESTDALKELLDGNRWMPLLVRDALIKTGVPDSNILTEVKHGEDEIDLLIYFRGRILVVEAKDRPISLNDAYKLSAKTSRLESVTERIMHTRERETRAALIRSRRRVTAIFTPVAISTHDIASDARTLLQETRESARVLENCETTLYKFIADLIESVNKEELNARLAELTLQDASDSVSNLAARQVEQAFAQWAKHYTSNWS